MSSEYVKAGIEAGVAVVVVDRPPVNALNAPTIEQLEKVFTDLERDPAVRAVVITGAGEKAFVAGADIGEFPTLDPATARELSSRGQGVFNRIEGLGKPVVAAVNGFALGGGLELAMVCDLRIASENARFGLPEINLGIIPGYGGTQRLARLVGKGKAKEMIFTGDMITATEAQAHGLVNAVVPLAELREAALQMARKLASKAPIALGLAKRAIDLGLEGRLMDGLDLEARLFGETAGTEDMREGVAAFLAKRPANFKGK